MRNHLTAIRRFRTLRYGPKGTVSGAEAISTVSLLGWAMLLLAPPVVLSASSAYGPMHRMASERTLGLVALTILTVFVVGVWCCEQWAHVVGLTMQGVWWAWTATMFYMTGSVLTGVVVYGVLAIATLWCVYLRVANGACHVGD